MAKIKIFPLGGQDERGKNCYVIEIDNEIFVFDVGVKIPINEKLGISMITSDYSYLQKNANRIKGIFIGYPYSHNYCGLPFLLQKIHNNTPVYCSVIGKIVIDTYYEKINTKQQKPTIVVAENNKRIDFQTASIVPVKITNSIPESLGWIIQTKDGSIIFLDEFMICNDKSNIFGNDIERINSITKFNNLLVLPSLGNVGNNKNYTTPNHKNIDYYESIVSNAKGRVFVACNDQDAYTVINLAQIAKAKKRPFCIYSNTFMNVFSGLVKNKMINTRNLNCVKISEINNSPNAIVVISSMQDNLFKLLMGIVNNLNNSVKFNSNDTFILGTQLIPGYEAHAARLMDELNRLDVHAYTLPRTYLPMCASNEDHKNLVDLLKPKYVMPIEGYYKSYVKYCAALTQTKIKPEQIVYVDNGEIIEFNNGVLNPKRSTYKLIENYIGNVGSVDVGTAVISERKQLAEAGIIFVTVAIDKNSNQLVDYLDVSLQGVLTEDEASKQSLNEVIDQFKNHITNCIVLEKNQKKIDSKQSKLMLKKAFTKIFEKKFNKRPIVLPSIIEIME